MWTCPNLCYKIVTPREIEIISRFVQSRFVSRIHIKSCDLFLLRLRHDKFSYFDIYCSTSYESSTRQDPKDHKRVLIDIYLDPRGLRGKLLPRQLNTQRGNLLSPSLDSYHNFWISGAVTWPWTHNNPRINFEILGSGSILNRLVLTVIVTSKSLIGSKTLSQSVVRHLRKSIRQIVH